MLGTRHEPDRHGFCLGANDGTHDLGTIPVVLGVVGRIDGGVHTWGCSGFGEGHVPFQASGPDATYTAGLCAPEPRVVRPVGGSDVEIIACPNDPHRHVGPQ